MEQGCKTTKGGKRYIPTEALMDDAVSLSKLEARARPNLNLLINGGFDFFQRIGTTSTAMVDDTYYADRWYALIQGANSTIQRVEAGDGARYVARLTAGGTTNRFGIAQIVEANDSIPRQGRTVRAQCRVKGSTSGQTPTSVRIAILEWTGTADSVTSDVVSTWTSGDFTTGNFFNSTTLNLIATDVVAVPHGGWVTLSASGVVGSTANNLIVMIWTQDVPGNAADYIDVSEAGLYDGTSLRDWLPRPIAQELVLCQRYYCKTYNIDVAPATLSLVGSLEYRIQVTGTSGSSGVQWFFPARMRSTPTTVTAYNPEAANSKWRNVSFATDSGTAGIANNSGEIGVYIQNPQVAGDSALTSELRIHATAEAEL